jgi:NAD(P)H-hydrate epimerase
MREIDQLAMGIGLSLVRMMENAGAALAELARTILGGDVGGRRLTVLAGLGGNGGGGLVAARHLLSGGAEVELRLTGGVERMAPVAREQLHILEELGCPGATGRSRGRPGVRGARPSQVPELFLDAILGYSQQGAPRGAAAELIAQTTAAPTISLDVPSGLELATGRVLEPAVGALATLTLAAPKDHLRNHEELVGELFLADISIPQAVFARAGVAYSTPFARGPIVRVVGHESATA